MKIVTIAATKGGAGKTTTACCLAFTAAERGLDVVLVDVDPQGTARRWAPDVTVTAGDVASAADILAAAGGHDLVFIDTPPGADERTVTSLRLGDAVVTPTALGPGDIDGLMDLTKMVDPDLIVPIRVDRRRSIHAHGLAFLRSRFGDRVTLPVPSATAVEWAQAEQEAPPPLSPVSIAYREVFARVLTLIERS